MAATRTHQEVKVEATKVTCQRAKDGLNSITVTGGKRRFCWFESVVAISLAVMMVLQLLLMLSELVYFD